MRVGTFARSLLVAHLLMAVMSTVRAEIAIFSGDTLISRGLISEKYWLNQNAFDKDEPLIAYANLNKRIEFDFLDNQLFIESRSIASLSTSVNSLTIFSKDDNAISNLRDGDYALNGKMVSVSYNALGIRLGGASNDKKWSWKFSPKILKITNFKSDSSDGVFSKKGDTSKLTAETSNIGYWEYGFFENGVDPVNFGNGITSDIGIEFNDHEISIKYYAENFYSRVTNQGLFYNSKRYQVESNKSIILSNILPAMSGVYGQSNFVSSLPRFSRLELQYSEPTLNMGFSLGIDSLDGLAMGWGAVVWRRGDLIVHAKTYAMKNLTFIGQLNHLGFNGLSVTLGLESDLKGEWQFNAARISLAF